MSHQSRDRAVILFGLAGVCILSWIYLFWMVYDMNANPATCWMHMISTSWTAKYFFLTLVMWVIMMVAMMVPSVTPMVLIFATVQRKRASSGRLFVPAWLFLGGYLAIWSAFSLAATLAQWGLHAAALLSPATLTVGPVAGGVLMVLAGVYQWTPWKNACLRHCVSPLGFLTEEWRDGRGGAFIMGLRHGLFCTGCCALLMALLFVAGVMNLLWVAALGAIVLIEKLVPATRVTTSAFGVIFIAAGAALLTQPLWKVA